MGDLKYRTNYMNANITVITVKSTNFSLPEMTQPSRLQFRREQLPNDPLLRGRPRKWTSSTPWCRRTLLFSRSKGLGMTGTVGTSYRIDAINRLGQSNWSTLTSNVVLAAGTNWVTNTTLSTTTNHFYRAFWLGN